MNERAEQLEEIRKKVVNLKKSPLYKYRVENNYVPVIGGGSENAKIIFIGEAPGQNEAKTGLPFVGRSGKFLDELLDSIEIKRDDVYITSVVKDRPPKNRDPKPEEISIYAPFLDEQIKIIKPMIIVTLGRFAMNYVMNHYGLENELKPIGELHGRVFETKMSWGKVKVLTLYHPSISIYNQHSKSILFEDFKILKTLI